MRKRRGGTLRRGALLALCLTTQADAQRKRTPSQGRYDDTFRTYGKRFFGPTFDRHHFKAQAMAESNLDPDAKSWVGARGIMQLMPSTYHEVRTDRLRFMFASYNAGRRTIRRAQGTARTHALDHRAWKSIETVAPRVTRWRHSETLDYVRRIEEHRAKLAEPRLPARGGSR